MRAKNREFNIFNLSFLDVICGAMGAFLIVMVVLMPYYKKDVVTVQHEMNRMKTERDEARARADALEQNLQNAQRKNAAMKRSVEEERKRRDTPLLVGMKWPSKKVDLDLYLIKPSGDAVGYRCKKRGSTELVFDYVQGGFGAEVIMSSRAEPGIWSICARYQTGERETIKNIRIRALDFSRDLSGILINRTQAKIAELRITKAGLVTDFHTFSPLVSCDEIPTSFSVCN